MKWSLLSMVLGLMQSVSFSQEVISVSPDLELIKISDNTYLHVSYYDLPDYGRISANGLIFIVNSRAILFDTPWNDSLTFLLTGFLKDHMGINLTAFVPNHWHEDCMGGLRAIKSQKISSFANQMTIDISKQKGLPVPDHGFRDSMELKLGQESVYCYFLGAAHSMDNIVVWIPSEGILFPGCMCKSIDSESLGNLKDGDINSYRATIEKVLGKFGMARIVVPGHGSPGGKELLVRTKELAERF
jgi:metallo-beta-lactamase class B